MPVLRLEDFAGSHERADGPGPPDEERDEALRQAAYEEGYAAGWEDATTACNDARADREAAAAQSLQALTLCHEQAQRMVLTSLEPLLREMVATLLPAMARAALVPQVIEALMPLAEAAVDTPLMARASIDIHEAVDRLLPVLARDLNVKVVEDATLPKGCVRISSGSREAQIDLSAALAAVAAGVADFFDIQSGGHGSER